MLHGFGQAPVCLEFDLDSFDGPWTYVERFRGRSGWLAVAETTLSGAAGERTTTAIAACDDRGHVFPTWQAEHLLACACSRPTECDNYPPMDLDELLDEAVGELATRWVRENSRALRVLAAKTTEQIAMLEAKARAAVEEADRRDALLRRRRRMTSPGSDAWVALTEAMTAVGLEREAWLHRLVERRAAMRREMAAADDAALHHANVEVEWELLYQVCWSTAGRIGEDRLMAQTQVSSGALRLPLPRHHREAERQTRIATEARAAAELRARAAAAQQAASTRAIGPAPAVVSSAGAVSAPLRIMGTAAAPTDPDLADPATAAPMDRRAAVIAARPGTLPPTEEPRTETSVVAPQPNPRAKSDTITDVAPDMPIAAASVFSPSAPPPVNAKLRIQRDQLAQQLGELEAAGRKYLSGSPKYARNRAERAALSARIRVLNVRVEAEPDAAVVAEPSLAELQAELRRHEQRGAKPSDGVTPWGQYRDRRQYLLRRIAELDARSAADAAGVAG